jgi:hypothetical protein
MSLNVIDCMHMKKRFVQHCGYSLCRSGYNLRFYGNFPFRYCVRMYLKNNLFFNYVPQKIIARGLSPVMLVAPKVLLHIAQGTGSTELAPQKRHPES